MFIGREKELRWLEEQYNSSKFEMSIIYGRRRIGKTRLIKEFIKDKKAIYFLATDSSEKLNLQLFSEYLFEVLNPGLNAAQFSDFHSAFKYLGEQAKEERIILVIDEYPYLAESVNGISSILQRVIDEYFVDTQLFIILCGSSMSFMEKQVLGQKSPLYGRRTSQMKLHSFTFREVLSYFPDLSNEEVAIYYGVTGGVAEYLTFIDVNQSLDDNLIKLFFESRGRLYEEPQNLLNQELRDPKIYNEILLAIAKGASKNNEIATAIGKRSSDITPYLVNLQELMIVEKIESVTEYGSKKPIYRVKDFMYRFWFKFVKFGQAMIELEEGKSYYNEKVKPYINEYMGLVFEQIVFEYMNERNSKLKFDDKIIKQGIFFGTDKQKRKEVEIDYLGISSNKYYLGEAKWRNEKIKPKILLSLIDKGSIIPDPHQYLLFSKSGFVESEIFEQYDAECISFNEICEALRY
ncbi:ATP-binding protein [Macrococcus capreoli]|uniref:ATP-binding protein n=1 Tax=Macrococcus capreoli TaxID=2982690 RepID=UPI003EE48271